MKTMMFGAEHVLLAIVVALPFRLEVKAGGVIAPASPFTPIQTLVIGTSDVEGHSATRLQCTAVETNRFFDTDGAARGGIRVAVGDVNGDGVDDIITGAGPGGGPHVKVFDGRNGSSLHNFFAFDAAFTGGVFVAVGDVNRDDADDIIVGADAGAGPHVRVFDGSTGDELQSFLAYAPTFTGGVRVAAGDISGDGVADIITGAGPGGGPHVKVFDGTNGSEIRSFFAFDPSFSGGVFVAGGQADNTGPDDIIVGGAASGRPHVRVFDGLDSSLLSEFPAFPSPFVGGVRVATGDINGDGTIDIIGTPDSDRDRELIRVFSPDGEPLTAFTPDVVQRSGGLHLGVGSSPDSNPLIVVGGGIGSPPLSTVFEMLKGRDIFSLFGEVSSVNVDSGDHNGDGINDVIVGTGSSSPNFVSVFDGASGFFFGGFQPYDPAFTGGVFVASADVSGNDGHQEIITGPESGMGPEVRIFDGQTAGLIDSFFAYDPVFLGGVRVATGDVNGDGTDDIITATGPGGAPQVKVFDGTDRTSTLHSFFAYDPTFAGGVFVASGDVNGDGFDDIITGPGAGGGPHIRIFDGSNPASQLNSFFAYDSSFVGGVRVAAGDVTGDGLADVVVSPPTDGPRQVRIFDGLSDNVIGIEPTLDARGISIAVCDRPRSVAEIDDLIFREDGSVDVGARVPRGLYLHVESGPTPANYEKIFDSFSNGTSMTIRDSGAIGQPRWFVRSRGR